METKAEKSILFTLFATLCSKNTVIEQKTAKSAKGTQDISPLPELQRVRWQRQQPPWEPGSALR